MVKWKPQFTIYKISVLLALLSNAPAIAGSASSSLSVLTSVVANCTVETTAHLVFGGYEPLVANGAGGSDLTADGMLSVACNKNTVARIAFNQGGNPAVGSSCLTPVRQMAASAERLGYDLYQDSGLTTVWGCDNPGSDMSYTASDNAPAAITIYGKIPKNQEVETGSYSDSVTATISF